MAKAKPREISIYRSLQYCGDVVLVEKKMELMGHTSADWAVKGLIYSGPEKSRNAGWERKSLHCAPAPLLRS